MSTTIADLYKRNKRERLNRTRQLVREATIANLAQLPVNEKPLADRVDALLRFSRPNAQDPAQVEALPAPVNPIDAAAAELQAQHGDFGGRLIRAVELAKAKADLSKYGTTYNPATLSGFYLCGCQDALYRASKWAMGAGCKHALQLHLTRIIALEAEAVAHRKLTDRIERRR